MSPSPAELRAEAWQARLLKAGSHARVAYVGGGWFAMRWLHLQGWSACQRGYDIEREVTEVEATHRKLRRAKRPGKPWDPARWARKQGLDP